MNDAEVSIKFTNQVTGEKKLEKYSATLSKINSVLSGMNTGMTRELEHSADSIGTINEDVSSMSKKVNIAFNYGLITRFAGAIRKLGAGFTSLAKQSFDYLENFNLFQVAFNGNYKSAERFINKMSEMYGLDESWLTRTVGNFKQLTNAMNLTAEMGEKVSTLLTQMSLDISSLYNVDIDRAAETLRSAMAGQTKPIRGVTGGDITQATLQTTLDQLGIDQAVNKLSYAEKRLLIIISLTRQLNASIGDMGRTIESPSNQLRIMNEQWERLTRAVGNVFLPILAKILPYLNAILMVLTEIISAFATLIGFKMDDFDYFDSASAGAWDLDAGMKSAGASAKKLKQGLRGFDKLNVITTPNAGGSGGGVGGAGGINPKLMDAFNKTFDDYQKKLGNVNMLATQIRDKIMAWLGFTKEIDEETGKVSFKLKEGFTRLKLIIGLLTTLVGLKLLKGLGGLITGTSRLGKLLGTGGLYTGIKKVIEVVSVLGAKDGLLYVFYNSKLGSGISALTSGFGKLAAALGLTSGALLAIIAAIVAVIGVFIHAYKTNEEFRNSVDKLVQSIKDVLEPMLKSVAKTLQMIWNDVLVPLFDRVLRPLIKLLVSILVPVLQRIIDKLNRLFDKIIKPLMPYLEKAGNIYLKTIIGKVEIIVKILEALITALQWLWDKLLQPIFEKTSERLDKAQGKIEDSIVKPISKVIDKLKEVWHNWLEPIYIFLKANILLAINEIKKAFDRISETWTKIKNTFKEVWEQYVQPKIDKIKEKVNELKTAWEKFKDKFKLPDLKVPKLPKFKLTITYDTKVSASKTAVYKALGLDGWPRLKLEHYAKGGLPPVGQMFIANEKGPELVGQIGGQSFVANQSQVVDLLDRKLGQAKSQTINPTFIIQVGSKEIAKEVINDLQDMAKTNGKPIIIGG